MTFDLDRAALDRHITGNWGEDQFRDYDPQPRCAVCGCWLTQNPDSWRPLSASRHCEGPNTDVYGPAVAGWVYTPCETDCTGPHDFIEDLGVAETHYRCRHCGHDNVREEM